MSLGYTQCVTGMNVSLESDVDILGLLPLCNELYGDELTERRRFFIKREPPTVSYFLCLDELSVGVFITIYYDSAVNGMGATNYPLIVFKTVSTR